MTIQTAGLPSGSGWSPLNRVQDQLQRAVSKGTVKTEDQDALSAAISDISAQLQAGGAGSTAAAATNGQTARPKIDDLISGEISSGKLTADQASELKSVFAQTAQRMHGHRHGPPPPSNDDSGDDGDSAAAPVTQASFVDFIKKLETALTASVDAVSGSNATTAATATTASATRPSSTQSPSDPKQLMLAFLKSLETALGGNNIYGASGTSSNSSAQAVLVNAMA